jgi:hypothetical protein
VAALCPAPIRDKSAKPHSLPFQTDAQRASELQYNGKVNVLGVVPVKTNEDGRGAPPIRSSAKAAANLMTANPDMQAKAVRNITVAQRQLRLDHQGEPMSPILVLLVVLGVVGGGLYGAKAYLDKHGPDPKAFRSAERATTDASG